MLAGNINNPDVLFRTPEDVRRQVKRPLPGVQIIGPNVQSRAHAQ